MKMNIRLWASLFMIMMANYAFAQVKVEGQVLDADNSEPVPGAIIKVKGTTVVTSSDFDGNFSVEVPAEGTVLEVSSFGFLNQEIPAQTGTKMKINMSTDVIGLDDVVVTAIGIKRETKKLGYAVEEVKSDALVRTRNDNIVNSLNGKVSGVQITNATGAAGGSSYITIRGAASLLGNNQPLFVVDGVPINNDGGQDAVNSGRNTSNRATDLNADDVESISVLKGGAATALYGLRAANGAIIITTKKGGGKKNKMNITYSNGFSMDKVSKLPQFQNTYAQGWAGVHYDGFPYAWGPAVEDMVHVTSVESNLYADGQLMTKDDADAFYPGESTIPAKTYDANEFFGTGYSQNHTLGIAGGNETSSYYFSAGRSKTNGIIPNNSFTKNTFRISGTSKLSDKFTASASANYMNTLDRQIPIGSNVSTVTLAIWRTPPTFDNAAGYENPDGSQRNYGSYDNPYWSAEKNRYNTDIDRMLGNTNLMYQFNDWISLSYRAGIDWFATRGHDYFSIGSNNSSLGFSNSYQTYNRDFNSDLVLSIDRDLTEDINAKVLLGNNMFESSYTSVSSTTQDLSIPGFYNLGNTTDVVASQNTFKKRTAAMYADFGLSYQSLFFANITLRNEWSTTLPADNNSFFYPSVSGSFIFTELDALKDNELLPFGKLRVSMATIANDATAYSTATNYFAAGFADGYSGSVAFPFEGYTGYELTGTIGSSDLRPEKMSSFEVGLDLRFVENRIGLDLSYYSNNHTDLLLTVPVASASGFGYEYKNAGSMTNKGLEVLLNLNPVRTDDLRWDATISFTRNRNEVTALADGVDNVYIGGFTSPQVRAAVGRGYKTLYGSVVARDDDGNVVYNDVTGAPLKQPLDNYMGDVNPDFLLDVTNTLTWKGVSFSMLWNWKKGGLMWNGTRLRMNFQGTGVDTQDREDRVLPGKKGHYDADGELVITGENDIEISAFDYYFSAFDHAELYVEETSWVRLREISLGYDLPKEIVEKVKLAGVHVFFSGRNLFLSTPYSTIDPESSLMGSTNAQGFDYFNMPGTKTYTAGLKVKI